MGRIAILTAAAAALASSPSFAQRASAQSVLAAGTCVITGAGYGSKGVITGTNAQGHYTIRADLTGLELQETHTGVVVVPCPTDAARENGRPAPRRDNTGEVQVQAVAQPTGQGGCFASETERAGLEGTFRGVIRQQFERQAAAGSDGTTTVRFLSFRMDGGRRATVIDRVNYKPDMSRPVYSVRALLQTCTDYRRATDTRTIERNFQCYTSSTGGYNCSASGSMAGMRKDENDYKPK